jgi:NTP pyrophosphatase (non-canonical NTP hydrolase)
MNLNEYQEKAMEFAVFESAHYPFYALAEEVGEVLGLVAKGERGDDLIARFGSLEAVREKTIKELGDVLWQLQACCSVMGIGLQEVAEKNIAKLEDRKARDVIKGAGDDR